MDTTFSSVLGYFSSVRAARRMTRDTLIAHIDTSGDRTLSSGVDHAYFRPLYRAFTPREFDLRPYPDDSYIRVADHRIHVRAVIVDNAAQQVVGEIVRDVVLEHRFVTHELLRVQRAYRGSRLSLVLLNESLPVYRRLGVSAVHLHAALETGRWLWARLGFDFVNPGEQIAVNIWANIILSAIGQPMLDIQAPARRLAAIGTATTPQECITLENLHQAAVDGHAAWQAKPAVKALIDPIISSIDAQMRLEWGGRFGAFDQDRLEIIARSNGMTMTDPLPIGKAIMLSGPDWHGVFDLDDPAAADAFIREFARKFSRAPSAW